MRLRVFALCIGLLLSATVSPLARASVVNESNQGEWVTELVGVGADSGTDAWAVGWSELGNKRKTLIENWDGASWRVVPSPNRSLVVDDVLTSVAAISPRDVWAVGFYQTKRGGYRTLVLHWDGDVWSHVRSPSGNHYTVLSSVSAASANDIWAVGSITKNEGQWYRALFEHWDGTSWTIVDSVLPRRRNGPVTAVSAVTGADVWAGGDEINGGGGTIFHRGDAWAPYTVVDGNVQDISMDSATDGWAVGGGLYLHWNGSDWVNTPGARGYLEAAFALSPSDAWAGGNGFEHWDGHSWTAVKSGSHATVWDMDGVSPDDIWAVSDQDPAGPAVIQHWDGATWSVYASGR
jgi:hypothetical protein